MDAWKAMKLGVYQYEVGNKARYLYEGLGFEELYVSENAMKYLRE